MGKVLYYIGTYTWEGSKGIYGTYMDKETKEFTRPELFAELASPTYMVTNSSKTRLYAVTETIDRTRGKVAAYSIEPSTGKLTKINEAIAPGRGMCHISIDPADSFLFTVSYSDATVQVYPIAEDGSVGEVLCVREHTGQGVNPQRQEKAHAHYASLTPDQKYLCVCDLGIDRVMVYRFDRETGQLELDEEKTVRLPDGCGPRHMTFHSKGKTAYVLSELSSQVFVLSYHPDRGFEIVQTVNALTEDNPDSIAAAIRLSPDESFLYTSNRGEDSISVFRVKDSGLLEYVSAVRSGGEHPRDFILSDSLLLCANRDTDNIVVFRASHDEKAPVSLIPIQEITGVSKPVSVLEYRLSEKP
jgi:6-phosphogluconolactonase